MKRVVIIFLFFLICSFAANAQRTVPYNPNTFFLSLNAGGGIYQHYGESDAAMPYVGVHAGRWIMKPLAFRLTGEMLMSHSPLSGNASEQTPYFKASASFLWDVNATFFHVYNYRYLYPIPFYPTIGLGLLYRPGLSNEPDDKSGDRDFQMSFGAHFPLQIGTHWDLFFEYNTTLLPQWFDGSRGDNFFHTFSLGFTYRMYERPFDRHTLFESRTTRDDWFVGYGLGLIFSSFEFENIGNLSARLWNMTPEIMFGRNFSNFWTVRAELSGLFARERYNSELDRPGMPYKFSCLNIDFMFNLSHVSTFNRGKRWNFLPYLGAGPVWRYDNTYFTVGADAGLMARRYIDNAGDFYIDLRYIMVPPRVAGGTGPSESIYGVGYPSLTMGYIHNIGRSTTRYRDPVGR